MTNEEGKNREVTDKKEKKNERRKKTREAIDKKIQMKKPTREAMREERRDPEQCGIETEGEEAPAWKKCEKM